MMKIRLKTTYLVLGTSYYGLFYISSIGAYKSIDIYF